MNIAIDARSLEGARTGVGRYLANLLEYWKNNKQHKFILYFKDKLPDDNLMLRNFNIPRSSALIPRNSAKLAPEGPNLLKSDNFIKKLLKNPLGFSSNFFFQHFLLPYHLKKDNADFFFSPFYLKPFYCPVKSSVVLHDISYEVHPEWFDRKSQLVLRTLSKFSAKTADAIFTVSNYSRNEIIKYYNTNPDKITVTRLAPDENFAKIDDLEKIKAVKKKYGIGGEFILCVGSIFNRRHIPEIIEAFRRIAEVQNLESLQLLIIGKNYTHPFADIDEKIKSANKILGRNAIAHLNFVDENELLAFYSSCKISIYLSDYEGFGLPVIEAQFFDKPVITNYNSSLIEVGDNSVEFVKKNTVNEIYESLKKVISDENYREELIKRGKENVKRFSWEKCARETIEKILDIRY